MSPNRRLELRWLVEYLHATDNEIAIDAIAYDLAGLSPREVGYFPRPSKWISVVGRVRWPFRLLGRVSAMAWRLAGAAVFHLLECVRFAHEARRTTARPPLASPGGYLLGLSSRAGDLIRPPQIEPVPRCWMQLPWAPLREPPQGSSLHEMLSVLTDGDLWRCYRLSILATRLLAKRPHSAPWVLQSYTAWRWFAVRCSLEKLDGPLFTAEHFDRWALLADAVVVARRRRGIRGSAASLVLVQHGEIGGLSPADWRTNFYARLKRKLRTVGILYAFGEGSADIFRTSLFSPACARAVEVKYYKPRILLRRAASNGRPRLLFVGHPLCEGLHVHVLQALKSERQLDAFYKPHPLGKHNPAMARHDWQIISDKDEFPEVEMLVSYPSTLVTEYAALNIPASVHPLHLDVPGSREFIAATLQQLDSLSSSIRSDTR